MDPDAGVGLYVADVYVCDRDPDGDGDFDEVLPDGTRDYGYASVGAKLEQGLEEGGGSDGISSVTSWPVISADGSSVAWEHHPDGTDADAPTVSVHVTRLGFGPGGRLLVQRLGGGPVAPAPAARPVISADGDYVTVLVEGRVVGVVPGDRAPRREEVLSVDENGALITSVHGPSAMSNDAHIVAFEHGKSESSGNSAIYNIVVRVVDRDPDSDDIPWPATGEPFTSRIASFDLRSGEGETTQAYSPSLSGDGRFLAFKAWDGGFLEGRLPDCSVPESCPPSDSDCAGCQIVARDLAFDRARVEAGLPLTSAYVVTQTTQECTPEDGRWQTGPCMGNSSSSTSSISADGGVIAFATRANNLAEGDDNSWSDVYARVLTPGVTGVSPTFTPVRPDGDVTGVVRFEYGTGFGPAHITGASVTGADSDEFTVGTANTCSGRAVYPGETCRVPVRFRPTGEAGTRTAQLELDVHGRAEPIVVPLEAAVDQPLVGPVLAVGSLDVAFGQRAIMASSEDTPLQITNRGDTAMTVTGVEIVSMTSAVPETALDYRVVSDACSNVVLAPGEDCVITLAHAPRAAGDRPAALLVTGTGDQSQLVLLNGSGSAPRLVASPAVGAPGKPTMVSGTGFPPGQRIELTSPGRRDRATATVRPDGTFTTPFLLFSGTAPGPRTIRASVAGTGTAAEAETPFLVTSARMAPPGFIWRR